MSLSFYDFFGILFVSFFIVLGFFFVVFWLNDIRFIKKRDKKNDSKRGGLRL